MTTATTLINFIKSNNPVWLLSSNLISSWSTNNLHFKTIKQLLKILVFLLCCGMNSISLFYCILSRFTKFWVNFWQHGESLTALTQITMSIKIKLPQCLKIDFKDNVSMFSMSLDGKNCGRRGCHPPHLMVIYDVVFNCGTVFIWLWWTMDCHISRTVVFEWYLIA